MGLLSILSEYPVFEITPNWEKKTFSALYWRTEMELVSKILQSVQVTDNK